MSHSRISQLRHHRRFHVSRTFTDSCQGCPRIVPAISILGSTERKKAGNDDLVGVESTQRERKSSHGEERVSFRPISPSLPPSSRFQIPFLIRVLCRRIYAHFDIRIGLKEAARADSFRPTKTLPHSVFRACHPFVSIV